jgi:hypothetical protein
MKKFILIIFFSLLLLKSFSQWGHGFINFDDTAGLFRISIDTSITNNIWQIGSPHKSFFSSSHSLPNAIVTDTLHPYPINNNSVFYYRTSGDYNTDSHDAVLDFWYKMDCDTLNDFGKVEISLDTGITWQNLTIGWWSWWTVYDSLHNVIQTSNNNDTIVFSGRTNGWYEFNCDVSLVQGILDSIIYRFTFHSSDFSVSREGWMIDDIQFNTWWESIPNLRMSYQAYPNPVSDQFIINSEKLIVDYEILNSMGCPVKKSENYKLPLNINVSGLPSGLYFYRIKFEDGQEGSGKFVKIF